jgi:hypothetical protein
MHEPVHVPSLPPDLVAGADISWARLITGVMLLVLSLVIGYRSAHHPPPPPKAEPHPVRQQLIVSADLPPLETAVVSAPRIIPDISAAPPVVPAARAEPVRELRPRLKYPTHRRSSMHARVHRHPNSRLVARSGVVRTRAQVEREYFRSRDLVAAFTGEDSGSVYLTRAAAEQRSSRFPVGQHRIARVGSARG